MQKSINLNYFSRFTFEVVPQYGTMMEIGEFTLHVVKNFFCGDEIIFIKYQDAD